MGLKYKLKVVQKPWGDSQVVLRELPAKAFQELQEKHGDSQGIDFAADLLQRALVEPAYENAGACKEDLLAVSLGGVRELVDLALEISGISEKNAR